MNRHACMFLMSSAALCLNACGGGGGAVASTPPPVAAPQPTPTPTPAGPPPLPAGPLGLTGSTFVAEGASWRGITGEWPEYETAELRTGQDVVAISYSEPDNSYTLTLPVYGEGRLVPTSGNGGTLGGVWADLEAVNYDLVTPGGRQPVTITMLYPGDPDPYPTKLSYTSAGRWYSTTDGKTVGAGAFAYGIPTAPAAMPVTGKASYSAHVTGYTRTFNDIWGTALLEFDFGQGTLAGKMTVETSDGWDPYPLGTLTFRDTVYSTGSASFAGRLTVPDTDQTGSFSGKFTGPAAEELLGSFRSPIFNGLIKKWDEIAGVWTGKRK